MRKTKIRILIVFIILFLSIISTNCSFAVENEVVENEIMEEHLELSYPDIEKTENTYGPLTMEQIIGGAAALIALVGIILAISLYARSREDYEDDWNEEPDVGVKQPEDEEPKAMKELKEEETLEQPKAVQEMEDQKKIEATKKEREEENKKDNNTLQENEKDKEDTSSLNYRHQKALDDFYNYAEEIKKEEKKPKRGKGKHSR